MSWCVPLLVNVAAGFLGYIVGMNPAPQNKYIIQHLMRLANREGMTQWGRMTLALVCDHKTVQVLLCVCVCVCVCVYVCVESILGSCCKNGHRVYT